MGIFIAQIDFLPTDIIPRLVEQFGLTAVATFIAFLFLLSIFRRRMNAQTRKFEAQTQAQEVLNSQFVLVQKENTDLQDRLNGLQDQFHKMRSDFAAANMDRISLSNALDQAQKDVTRNKRNA